MLLPQVLRLLPKLICIVNQDAQVDLHMHMHIAMYVQDAWCECVHDAPGAHVAT